MSAKSIRRCVHGVGVRRRCTDCEAVSCAIARAEGFRLGTEAAARLVEAGALPAEANQHAVAAAIRALVPR
jgi:hypothetical protein